MTASVLVFLIVLLGISYSRTARHHHSEINCDKFDNGLCVNLAHDYYGLSYEDLMGYSEMQRYILSDSIECHYIYDVCPFYVPPIKGKKKNCINGKVSFVDDEGETKFYDCRDVDLYSFIPLSELGSNNNASGADIWGYQVTNEDGIVIEHYAITTQADGSTIVNITDPINPHVLAFIVSNVNGKLRNVLWRDVKIYKEFAIISADTGSINDHGLQIYNLTKIINDAVTYHDSNEGIYNVPKSDVIVYDQVGACHNVYVNQELGHLYAFGSTGTNGNECSTGIHIIDINDPYNPTFLSCYDGSDYVHDAQCVIYHGLDTRYTDHEICFMFTPVVGNLTIVDVSNKNDIKLLSSTTYYTSSYNHQGWITSNHEYLLLDDETDEGPLPDRFPKTQDTQTTYIFDIFDLEHPIYRKAFHSHVLAVDHNQYILDNGDIYSCNDTRYKGYTFQANYEAGLRILNIDNIANEFDNNIYEIAYFDIYPWKYHDNGTLVHDIIKFYGAWSVFPYFNEIGTNISHNIWSKTTIVQSTTTGLYILSFSKAWTSLASSGPTTDANIFKWNGWVDILIIVCTAAVIIMIFIGYFRICNKTKTEKLIKEYENIDASKYGGTTSG